MIRNKDNLDKAIAKSLEGIDFSKTGIMLSGGIDSALLASYLPAGTLAFTITYPELDGVDESEQARIYAEKFGLNLVEVPVTFQDVLDLQDDLMLYRKEPLQAIEPAVNKICTRALDFGLENIIAGIGSDARFGGFTRLMSKEWDKEPFIDAYTFLKPEKVLKNPIKVSLDLFDDYEKGGKFDVDSFMANGYGAQTAKAFVTNAKVAGINLIAPYETMERAYPLNREEIANGNEKKIMRDLFRERTGLEAPRKNPLPRPLSVWKQYYGPLMNEEFYEDAYDRCDTDEQRWIVYTLDHWLYLYKNNCFKHYDIGYTTGVYDMFHMGHLNILRRASKMVDKLVVGVTSDALVSYKNKQSVIHFEDRIRIIRALPFVYKAVAQTDMDKAKACKKYGAHAIIVGDDWKNTEKWNNYEKELKEIRVDVVYLPYTKRVSSTMLRKEIGK